MIIVLVLKEKFMFRKDQQMQILGKLLFRKHCKIDNFIQVIILTMITVNGLYCTRVVAFKDVTCVWYF